MNNDIERIIIEKAPDGFLACIVFIDNTRQDFTFDDAPNMSEAVVRLLMQVELIEFGDAHTA